jgi:hypothetical protein
MTIYTVTTTYGLASVTEDMDAFYLERWIEYLKERHEVCEVTRYENSTVVDIKIARPRAVV